MGNAPSNFEPTPLFQVDLLCYLRSSHKHTVGKVRGPLQNRSSTPSSVISEQQQQKFKLEHHHRLKATGSASVVSTAPQPMRLNESTNWDTYMPTPFGEVEEEEYNKTMPSEESPTKNEQSVISSSDTSNLPLLLASSLISPSLLSSASLRPQYPTQRNMSGHFDGSMGMGPMTEMKIYINPREIFRTRIFVVKVPIGCDWEYFELGIRKRIPELDQQGVFFDCFVDGAQIVAIDGLRNGVEVLLKPRIIAEWYDDTPMIQDPSLNVDTPMIQDPSLSVDTPMIQDPSLSVDISSSSVLSTSSSLTQELTLHPKVPRPSQQKAVVSTFNEPLSPLSPLVSKLDPSIRVNSIVEIESHCSLTNKQYGGVARVTRVFQDDIGNDFVNVKYVIDSRKEQNVAALIIREFNIFGQAAEKVLQRGSKLEKDYRTNAFENSNTDDDDDDDDDDEDEDYNYRESSSNKPALQIVDTSQPMLRLLDPARGRDRSVLQVDLHDIDRVIKIWPTLTLAARHLNIYPVLVKRCLAGEIAEVGGFQWIKADEYEEKVRQSKSSMNKKRKLAPEREEQENDEGAVEKKEVMSSFSPIFPITSSDFSTNNKSDDNSRLDFTSVEVDENFWMPFTAINNRNKNNRCELHSYARQTFQVSLDINQVIKLWPSDLFPSKSLNISKKEIRFCLDGRLKNTGGYRWMIASQDDVNTILERYETDDEQSLETDLEMDDSEEGVI